MKTETMTIHQALAELKMLDNRIYNKITGAKFVVANKASNEKIDGTPVKEFLAEASSTCQSILDLICRRKAIRNALSLSNATTMVTIAGSQYTVAEAIEMKKTGIDNLNTLVTHMARQLDRAIKEAENANRELEAAADKFVSNVVGAKEKMGSEDANAIREAYVKPKTVEVLKIKDFDEILAATQDEVAKFTAEVDAQLSISNALTTITIAY